MKISNLTPPPRDVPFPLSIAVIFGGLLNIVGWILLVVGCLFSWVFVAPSDLFKSLPDGEKKQVLAQIIEIQATNSKVNNYRVKKVNYEFSVLNEKVVSGSGFSESLDIKVGQKIQVEYLQNDPKKNRALSLRAGIFPAWVSFVFIFPFIGVVLVAFGLRNGVRAQNLLKKGEITRGTLIRKEATNVTVNNKRVMRYIFTFEAKGQTWEVKGETTGTELTDEAEEMVFYDPKAPGKAILCDALPGKPSVDSEGNLKGNWYIAIAYLLLPCAFVLLNLLAWRISQSLP